MTSFFLGSELSLEEKKSTKKCLDLTNKNNDTLQFSIFLFLSLQFIYLCSVANSVKY